MKNKYKELEKKAFQLREEMLEMCIRAGDGHVTSCLSCADILTVLFYGGYLRHNPKQPHWEQRDRFILSKAQASPLLYVILADRGFFPKKEREKFAQKDGRFGIHLQHTVPGAEITAGSLGHGFGLAAGIALGAKLNRELFLTYTLLGDGELYEGSVWETVMFAAHNNLNNLIAIVDRNYQCTMDFTENIIELEPLEDKWRAFGWEVKRVDGHNFEELDKAFMYLRSRRSKGPTVIIADTVKGRGIDYISNIPLWHGSAPIKKRRYPSL
jgi:transketolase